MAVRAMSKVQGTHVSEDVYKKVYGGLCQLEQEGSEKSQMLMRSLLKNAQSRGQGDQKTHFSDVNWKWLERVGLVGKNAPSYQIMYCIVRECLRLDTTSDSVHVIQGEK